VAFSPILIYKNKFSVEYEKSLVIPRSHYVLACIDEGIAQLFKEMKVAHYLPNRRYVCEIICPSAY
jgi:hypothetical protein